MSEIYELPGKIYENFETGKTKGFKRLFIIATTPLLMVVGATMCVGILIYDLIKGNKNDYKNKYKEVLSGTCSGCGGSGIHSQTNSPCRCEYGIRDE